MDLPSKRRINERKFEKWDNLPGGGRKYSLDVKGKHGWTARSKKGCQRRDNKVLSEYF